MDQIEAILQSDDQHLGSFGSLEKGIAYTTLLCLTVPLLVLPLLHLLLRRNIYKTTALLLAFCLLFFLTLRFRFSWIVRLQHHLQRYYAA